MGKRLLGAGLLTAAIVLLGVLAAGRLFEDEPPAAGPMAEASSPDAGADAGEVGHEVRVLEVRGAAEHGAGDRWEPLREGSTLAIDDMLRTGDDGVVILDVAGTAQVEVDPGSQISVPAITHTASRLALEQGRVAARVAGGSGRTFGITFEGAAAVAETDRGEFAVIAGSPGEATVAATEGEVKVSAERETVTIEAGEQSLVRAGQPPGAPQPVPASLFLKVDRPKRVVRARQLEVRGDTAPGAVIAVNGVRVRVSESGTFTTVVPLEEGKNRVSIEGRDVTGRREQSEMDITVDTKGPSVGGEVKWGP